MNTNNGTTSLELQKVDNVIVSVNGEDYLAKVRAEKMLDDVMETANALLVEKKELQKQLKERDRVALQKSIQYEFTESYLRTFLDDFEARWELENRMESREQTAHEIIIATHYCAAARHLEKVGSRKNHIVELVQEWIDRQ